MKNLLPMMVVALVSVAYMVFNNFDPSVATSSFVSITLAIIMLIDVKASKLQSKGE